MDKINVLWADDEIDLLKPHVMFLEDKGYRVETVNNGYDAIEKVKEVNFDAVLLDENMPGYSGLETLAKLKETNPMLPVIMITKSEEEHIMEDAIGSKISDYLIKPVNPNQILLSLKKNLENKRLIKERSNQKYQQEFRNISISLSGRLDTIEWYDLYRKLAFWDLELGQAETSMREILNAQKKEANSLYAKFVSQNYIDWLHKNDDDIPIMSHTLLKDKLIKGLSSNQCDFLIVVDNLRHDQWLTLKPHLQDYFNIEEEGLYTSILPTATHYARNSLFAGLLPSEIEKIYPDLWMNEDDEGNKNDHEHELLKMNLRRCGKDLKTSYFKVLNSDFGKRVNDQFNNLLNNNLNVIVYNFVDMLSHAATDTRLVKELAEDEAAYRDVTLSWFKHSNLSDLLKKIADAGKRVFLTTDHGTIYVTHPSKVVGDRSTNTNLRYKVGKNLQYNEKEVFEIKNPKDAFLPKINVSSKYIFAKESLFFAYPNNYNHYVNYYKNTFQHGGVSMEEMMVPFVKLGSK